MYSDEIAFYNTGETGNISRLLQKRFSRNLKKKKKKIKIFEFEKKILFI